MEKFKKVLRKIGHIIWDFIQVFVIVFAICVTSIILLRNKFGYTQIEKLTMVTMEEDTYEYIDGAKEGDLLLVKSSKKIQPGDVIYYYLTIKKQYVVRMGVVKEVTEGDSNALYILDDKQKTVVASTKILGKESKILPKWGTVIDILTSRLGFLVFILFPLMAVFIYQIYEFIMVLKYQEIVDDKVKDIEDTITDKKEEHEEVKEEPKEEKLEEVKEEPKEEKHEDIKEEPKEEKLEEVKEEPKEEKLEDNKETIKKELDKDIEDLSDSASNDEEEEKLEKKEKNNSDIEIL